MNPIQHLSEHVLIDFHLREPQDGTGLREAEIRHHLEACPECAALSGSIAETLRVFSAEPVPQPNLEHNWQRLRGNLSVLTAAPAPRRYKLFLWPAAGLAFVAVLLLAFIGIPMANHRNPIVIPRRNTAINGHGPITSQPADPAVSNYLDAAERLLTEVNNTSGPLDTATRQQAHNLLLKNAVYVQSARSSGDLADASILEDFGRVLTTVDNAAPTSHSTLQLRLQMNTQGLLLDIRILRQNGQASQ